MRHVLAALAVSALLSTAACAQTEPPVVGGYAKTEVTPEASKAADFAIAELKLPADQFERIENISQQVVAGMNYRFDIVLKDKRVFRVVVWKKLGDAGYELTSSEQIHAH